MNRYSLTHLSDQTLLRDLALLVARDRVTTADLLAHIAEADARRLHVPAGHPSMFSYCVHELWLSEDAAFKRIRAARAARRFPTILAALAEGRLHLTAVVQLAPHLDPANADELLTAAMGKTKAQVEQLVSERFPRPDLPTRIVAVSIAPASQVVPEPVENWPLSNSAVAQTSPATPEAQLVPEPVGLGSAARLQWPKVTALAPKRYGLQFTVGQSAHDKLRRVQALLGHQVPSGDLATVFERAMDALIRVLEKQKFAATDRPRKPRPSTNTRHIPAQVKRAVWKRDGGRCTFVSDSGHRCPSTALLEYDHVHAVALGGSASVLGIRLRCRAHNHHEAERTFGVEFMRQKRQAARQRQEVQRNAGPRREKCRTPTPAVPPAAC